MRKEAKQAKSVQLARVQGYHEGGYHANSSEAYAYMGFKSNKYFTSDRFITLDSEFNRPDGQPLQGFGLEIETECSTITDSDVLAEIYEGVIFPHFPADLFKMQHDGSLGGRSSAECITQVMTKSFIRNNYRNFKLMFDTYFKSLGISAGSANCGMHTNISLAVFGKTPEAQEEAVRKLYYFVNKHYGLACRLFQRDTSCTHYCRQMEYINAKTMNLHNFYTDHGVCFNLGHYDAGRIEIRLVGGQKSFGAFRNTMECIFFLCDRVRKISWAKLDDFTEVFKGCNQYVYDRLRTKCADCMSPEAMQEIGRNTITEDLL